MGATVSGGVTAGVARRLRAALSTHTAADRLHVLAAVLGGVALTAWVWPARVPSVVGDVAVPVAVPVAVDVRSGSQATGVREDGVAARIADRDPFSATRSAGSAGSAPRPRWRDETLDAMAAMTMRSVDGALPVVDRPVGPPAVASTAATSPAAGGTAPPRRTNRVPALFGTVLGGDVPRALLRLDERVPGAQLYAEGASAGGWRVARVGVDGVTLTGARGRTLTLRLGETSER